MKMNWNTLEQLSNSHGDSFYIFDSSVFKKNYQKFIESFRRIYPNTRIGYSYKTNYMPALCDFINQRGEYAEVVSDMEYDLAVKVGVSGDRIIVNGPYKTKQMLGKFFRGNSIVNIDSLCELDIILYHAQAMPDSILNVGIRCNFDVDGVIHSRFGIDIKSKEFKEVFERLRKQKNIIIKGIHCHFPNRDLESYAKRVDQMLQLADGHFSQPPEFIDIGGGYFGQLPQELGAQFAVDVPSYDDYSELIATKIQKHYSNIEAEKRPQLILEPGSALVANTMQFVARVVAKKTIRGKEIAIVAGSKFNMGLLSSKINLPLKIYSENNSSVGSRSVEAVDISGYTCIESDYLYYNYNGAIDVGDFAVFGNVGSYSIVFKPPFIQPNVPIIEYDPETNTSFTHKRSESVEDIFATYTIKKRE